MNKEALHNIWGIKAIPLDEPTEEIAKELIFTDSASELSWPNRRNYVAFVNIQGSWNDFSPAQSLILKSIGALRDAAVYTYILRKENWEKMT